MKSTQLCVVLLVLLFGDSFCSDTPVLYKSELKYVKQNVPVNQSIKREDIPNGASATNANSNPEEYRASYYYPAPHHPSVEAVWNRDSYANAAADLGYNSDSTQYQQHGSSMHSSYHVPSTSYGTGDSDDFDSYSGGGLGGLAGLAGLLGVKGLKGLGLLGLLKIGLIPLLIIFAPILLLIPLALLFFLPIPVITIPTPAGRSIGSSISELQGKMSSLARSVLESDKCIERISCELSKYSEGTFIDKTLKRMIHKFENHMPNPLQRMARAYLEPVNTCQKFGCFIIDDVRMKKPKSKKSQ